jgi:hypothetical protein
MRIDLVTSARWQANEPGAFHGKIHLGMTGPKYIKTELRFTATWTTREAPCTVNVRRRDHSLFQVEVNLAKQEMLTRPGKEDETTLLAEAAMPAILYLLGEISLQVDPATIAVLPSSDITLNDAHSVTIECSDDSILRYALLQLLKLDVPRPRG